MWVGCQASIEKVWPYLSAILMKELVLFEKSHPCLSCGWLFSTCDSEGDCLFLRLNFNDYSNISLYFHTLYHGIAVTFSGDNDAIGARRSQQAEASLRVRENHLPNLESHRQRTNSLSGRKLNRWTAQTRWLQPLCSHRPKCGQLDRSYHQRGLNGHNPRLHQPKPKSSNKPLRRNSSLKENKSSRLTKAFDERQ